ncbi:MAG: hypothetical protein VXW32_06900 [Myxococcota bacterium]|nr:hypothetical protein [Myxococcota bacterium]
MSKIQDLIEEYGKIALVIYLFLWAIVVVSTLGAIALGLTGEKVDGLWAMIVASWVMAKITQVPRIAATLALTPVVSKWWKGRSRDA